MVERAIKQRVADAQKEHDEKKVALEEEKARQIASHAEEMVNKIISK